MALQGRKALSAALIAAAALSSPSSVWAQEADRSAIIRMAVLTGTTTLDPHASSLSTQPVHTSAWDRLVRFDAKEQIRPQLATSWEWSGDGKTLTFRLVGNATFHDGSPVDARAVVASIERAKSHRISRVGSKFANVEKVVAVDPHTVQFVMASGGADLLGTLAMAAGSIINPACIEKDVDLTRAPAECTSSAMVFSDGVPNGTWSLRRARGEYWDPQAFRYAGVDFIRVQENEIVLNAMQAGDIDSGYIFGNGVSRAVSLVRQGVIRGVPFRLDSARSVGLFLNPRVAPFNDTRLRQAVQAAINATPMGEGLYEGYCHPVRQPIKPDSWAGNAALEKLDPFDPARAKALLKEAGVPEGFSFTVFYQNTGFFNVAGQAAQEMLRQVGINLRLNPVQAGTVPEMIDGTAQSVISTYGEVTHPSHLLDVLNNLGNRRLAVLSGSPIEAEVGQIAERALNPALSQQEQGSLWASVWQKIYDEALTVVFCQFDDIWPTTNRLRSSEFETYPANGPLWGTGYELRYLYAVKR